MATVGVAAGLDIKNPGFVYFDTYDDVETPSTNTNGYRDAMGLSMLTGNSWHAHMSTLPSHEALTLDNFVFVGLRDVSAGQRKLVEDSLAVVVRRSSSKRVDYPEELSTVLEKTPFEQALVHLDLDVLDETAGKVNGYESPGGWFEEELMECMKIVPTKVAPVPLTVCLFNSNQGVDGDKIATIGVGAIRCFVESLIESKALSLDS
jgi:arginase